MKKKFGVILLVVFLSLTLISSVIYFNNKQESFEIRDKAKGISNIIYVDKYNKSGYVCSDNFQGTDITLPLCNIQTAVNKASGDTIINVREGTYYELIDFTNKSNITLTSQEGENVTINGALEGIVNKSTQWNQCSSNTCSSIHPLSGRTYTDFYYIDNFSFVYNVTAVRSENGQYFRLFTYGTCTEGCLNQSTNKSYNFDRLYAGEGIWQDDSNSRLYIYLESGNNPNSKDLFISRSDWIVYFKGTNNVIVKNMKIYIGGESIIQFRGDSNGNELHNLELAYAERGIWFKYCNSQGGGSCSNNKIYNNLIYDDYNENWTWEDVKDKDKYTMEMQVKGIDLGFNGDNNSVTNNTVHGWFDGIGVSGSEGLNPTNTIIAQNSIYDCRDDGLSFSFNNEGTKVYNNTVKDTYVGLSLAPVTKGPMYIYRNTFNLVKKFNWNAGLIDGYGIKMGFSYSYSTYTRDVKIYHNTFYINGILNNGLSCYAEPNKVWAYNFEWYNNIFYSNASLQNNVGLATNGNILDYNWYYRTSAGRWFEDWNSDPCSGLKYYSLDEARNSSYGKNAEWEVHGLLGDPSFINLNTGDFNLSQNSLAINHGRQLPAGWPDTNVVTDGIPDIGAFEYSESVTPDNPLECTPQCEGYECGKDNCGGNCGICPEGQTCKKHICKNQKKYTIIYLDIAPRNNPDGFINMYDLSLVLANWKWKKEPRDEKADLNEDGEVDMLDIALIESYWTKKY